MKPDKSRIIYKKWEKLSNKKVKLLLKTGEEKIGIIQSFAHGNQNFISYWILRKSEQPFNLLFEDEEWIKSKDILQIFFYDDQTVIVL